MNIKPDNCYKCKYLLQWTVFNKRSQASEATYEEPEREYKNTTLGYDLRNTSLLGIHKITYGTDYNPWRTKVSADGYRVYTTGVTEDLNISGGEIDNRGLYIEDEMQLNRLTLTLGARYDYHELGGIYDGTFKKMSQIKSKISSYMMNYL